MKITIESLQIAEGKLILSPAVNSSHLIYQIVQEVANSKKPYEAEFSAIKKKRSLNSNSYVWLILGKIADLLRKSKEEVYLEALKDYGQSQLVSVIKEGAETFKRSIKYYEDAGESVLNGKTFEHIKCYVGSSEFSSVEMGIFVEGIVSDAKLLDIEVMTPNEISLMNSRWKEEE